MDYIQNGVSVERGLILALLILQTKSCKCIVSSTVHKTLHLTALCVDSSCDTEISV